MGSEREYFTNDELNPILYDIVERHGYTDHIHVPMSMLPEAVNQIVTQQFEVASGSFQPNRVSNNYNQREIKSMSFVLRFTKARMEPHTVSNGGTGRTQIDPSTCRKQQLTYCADLYLDAVFSATAIYHDETTKTIEYEIKDAFSSSIPIEVGNQNCVYKNMTRDQIYLTQGDEDFYRGLFIIEGQIYVIHTVEMNKYNQAKVEMNMYGKEIARSTYLAREAIYRNSYQMIIRRLNSNMITIEMTIGAFTEKQIPFSLFFYMLGVTSDLDIENMIAMSDQPKSQINHAIRQIVQMAVNLARNNSTFSTPMNMMSSTAVMIWLINHTMDGAYDKAHTTNEKKSLIGMVQNMLDNMFLVNQTIATKDTSIPADHLRRKKAIILASMIHDTILTSVQRSEGTDRDNVKNKRYHTVGQQFTRIFKKNFNLCAVKPIRDQLIASFTKTDFSVVNVVDIVKTCLSTSDLLKAFEREIKSSVETYTIKNVTTKRVLNTESLTPPKSMAHLMAIKRTVVRKGIVSKEAARARELRSVHSSKLAFVCPVTSADTGESVGMADQLTLQTTVTNYLPVVVCREFVWTYEHLIRWDRILLSEMKTLTLVYINGDWYGGVRVAHKMLDYLRDLRRKRQIDMTISIVYDTRNNRIDLWTDEGRLITPFIIVYRNDDELRAFDEETLRIMSKTPLTEEQLAERRKKRPQFHQTTRLTRKMIEDISAGRMSFDDLIDQGVMEYVSSEEIQNCIAAQTHKQLWENRHNEREPFSHCMIPLGMFGIPAWTGTLPTMSEPTRHCFLTNMVKGANGILSVNQAVMGIKNMSVQMNTFYPVNPTPGDIVMNNGGQHANVSFRCNANNQEDSLDFNEAFIQRCGFVSSTFNKKIAECRGPNEKFGVSNPENTRAVGANRTKLKGDVHVAVGTIVTNGDVLVTKYSKREINGQATFVDTSVIYDHHENAYVTNIERMTIDNVSRIIVHYRILRHPSIGSKFSSRSGNKGVISRIIPDSQMPYGLFSGRKSDIMVNCHSYPSRMLSGEVIADLVGELAAIVGVIMPVSPFMDIDPKAITDALLAKGRNPYGLEPMRDATTSTITRALCITMSFRQCLQKFAEAEASARTHGRLSPVTRNSLAGAQNHGGMRTGEMEYWVIGGQGTAAAMNEFQAAKPTYFEMTVCRRCGLRAISNPQRGIYICSICKSNAQLAMVPTKFTSNSLLAYMEGMGISPRLELKPMTRYDIK